MYVSEDQQDDKRQAPIITLVNQILAAKQNPHVSVIPAEAGIQSRQKNMDSRFYGNDISGISVDTSALERQIDVIDRAGTEALSLHGHTPEEIAIMEKIEVSI